MLLPWHSRFSLVCLQWWTLIRSKDYMNTFKSGSLSFQPLSLFFGSEFFFLNLSFVGRKTSRVSRRLHRGVVIRWADWWLRRDISYKGIIEVRNSIPHRHRSSWFTNVNLPLIHMSWTPRLFVTKSPRFANFWPGCTYRTKNRFRWLL